MFSLLLGVTMTFSTAPLSHEVLKPIIVVDSQVFPIDNNALIVLDAFPWATTTVKTSNEQKLSLEQNPTAGEVLDYIRQVFGDFLTPYIYQAIKGESEFRQFDDNGNVLTHVNKNGSTDKGIMQINSIHDEEVTQSGLDICNSWKDNILFGYHIYEKQGLSAWYGFNPSN